MIFLLEDIEFSYSDNSEFNFSILFWKPAISSSRSLTSRGSSPLIFLISSILESIICKSYSALNFFSTEISFFLPWI